jgi:16S rRNA (cytidine1402-2'-O)-methyltransferase
MPTNSNTTASGPLPRGELYIVSTPIGNLEDITLRALRILKEADLIACEDTRQTRKLLAHYSIERPTISYHEHNEASRAPQLLEKLKSGAKIALVSDAGTPLVSDPGHRLVALCLENKIPVVPIPGPSALTTALAASGLEISQILFAGFLPSRAGPRRTAIKSLASEPRALILYEAPHRILATLTDALEILGNRPAVIARELTKLHEEFHRGRLSELIEQFRERPPRGEMTLIISPPHAQTSHQLHSSAQPPTEAPALAYASPDAPSIPIAQRVQQIMAASGLDQKAALKQAARERGLPKREAYKLLHRL